MPDPSAATAVARSIPGAVNWRKREIVCPCSGRVTIAGPKTIRTKPKLQHILRSMISSSDYRFTVGHLHIELQARELLSFVTSTCISKLLKMKEFQVGISAPSAQQEERWLS